MITTDYSQFTDQLANVMRAAEDGWAGAMEPAASAAFEAYANEIQERFDSEGFGFWIPLTPGTLREKARLGYPPWILYATGYLRSSLIPGLSDNIWSIEADAMTYGTSVEYAYKHQEGDSLAHLPQRTILVVPSSEVEDLCATLMNDLICEIGNA
jgi:hypothetical protein